MKIDIDKLSEAELIDLNHRIVERLRFLNQMRRHSQMLDFTIGERVTFHPEGHPQLFGIITRYNKKTVTVITDTGQHWNVAPGFLQKADSQAQKASQSAKVVPLKRE
jgi:glycosidase